MKKYLNTLLTTALLSFVTVLAADAQTSRDFRPDYDYYGEEFDWRWDVRVRISDGINNGLLTRWEANRLYNRLENIEQKEYTYAADGFYDAWEQNDVWQDVQWLHNRVGLELRDFDRTYYGFNNAGFAFSGYPSWWYNGGYNFYRFDRRGFGSISIGYAPQCFVPVWVPNRTVYVNNYRTYGHTYYRNNDRNRVVYNNTRVDNSRNVTNAPRTNGRSNSAVYNRNSNARVASSVAAENSRSRGSEISRSNSDNNTVNRAETRTREYSRPATTAERPATVNRSYEGRSESLNNTRSARSAPSAVSTSTRSASSGNSVSTSAGRTKLPEARGSTSAPTESRSATTTSSRRGS